MNKFGIFNLLNSFFPLTGQKNSASPNTPLVSNDLLTNLLTSFTKSANTKNNEDNKKESPPNAVPHPLQEQMLSTVTKHDALVKRVNQSQKTF